MSKECGDCGLCCKLMGVRGVNKPPHRWCAHYSRSAGGCTIYADRPTECGDFICYWLRIESLGPEWRPDRAKFVMHLTDGGDTLEVETDPSQPTAWRREPYLSQLKAWAMRGAARGLRLKVWIGDRCLELTPDGEVDHGRLRSIDLIRQEMAG
jgi:hypothetical protein